MRSCFQATLGFLAGACLLGAAAWGQGQYDSIQRFQTENPGAHPYFEEGELTALYGRAFAEGATPEDSVADFLDRYADVVGPGLGELRPIETGDAGEIVRGVKYDPATDTYEFSLISFEQTVADIPVFRSKIGFLMRNEPGYPLVLTGFSVREVSGFMPAGNADPDITGRMMRNARRVLGAADIEAGDGQLVIYAGVERMRTEPRLAVVFTATTGSPATYPNYQKRLFVADAQNGEILYTENQIHEITDVSGNVSGMATDGIQSGDCDPQALMGMPYAEVRIQGGNTEFADINGDFLIPHGGNGQVTVESYLRGPWFEVRDLRSGGSTPLLTMNVDPPGPANFIHNQANNSEFLLAGVDAYLHSNVVRDFVLQYSPNFPVIDTQQGFDVNININSNCNAYYDGESINFYTSGGGCSNTANSTVVHHEYGHHLIAVTGNGQGQMGEGTSDTMGVLITDQPWLAPGFRDCNVPLRNADNNLQYPCNGGHNCAPLLSGAVWDTRNELIVTEPDDYQDILSTLFIDMLIVRGSTQGQNGTQITPFITLVMLQLDDDDGNINNGTPHYFEIATGFGAHNLDAPPIDFTTLDDFEVTVGTHISGDLGDVETSNNVRLRTRSGFGTQLNEVHKMEMIVSGSTIVDSPSDIDLTIESRNNEPGGTGFVSLRHWGTNQFDQVGSYAVNGTDNTRNIDNIPAGNYINGSGEFEVQLKYVLVMPFFAFNFDSFFDVIRVDID